MIQPEFKPLLNILQGKLFTIPQYQRHYSWQTKHRQDLFKDIRKLQEYWGKDKNRIHFMATLVCLKKGGDPASVGPHIFHHYDVVDGQQRLTTLIILLKSISLKLRELKNKSYEEIDRLVVKDDKMLIILQNNQDNRFLLRNYLEKGKQPTVPNIKTQADKNLELAIKECRDFVNESSDVVGLLGVIQNGLWFTFQEMDDAGAVYTLFEVLNSRGLEVDWLDKCKCLLMGLLYEYAKAPDKKVHAQHERDLQCLWTDIYGYIGQQNIPGHEIVRYAATLRKKTGDEGKPLSAEDALEFFKEDCSQDSDNNKNIERILDNTEWLKKVTYCLFELYGDKKMKAVTEVGQARLLAVSIKLTESLNKKEKVDLLEQWERTTFRIYGFCRKDARYRVGNYVRLAKTIQRDPRKSSKDLLVLIAEIDKTTTIDEAVDGWANSRDVYNDWQTELRYFFYKYEEYLVAKGKWSPANKVSWDEIWASTPNSTIEHILPQFLPPASPPPVECWQTHFTADEHKQLVDSIGNLCLLPPKENKEASYHLFGDKLPIYDKVKLELLEEIKKVTVWDKKAIEERKERLIKFAKEQWRDL